LDKLHPSVEDTNRRTKPISTGSSLFIPWWWQKVGKNWS